MPASTPLPSTVFSTEPLQGEERFEAWRQSISVVFDVAPLNPQDASAFDASVQATHLGMVLLGDLRFSGQQFSRQRSKVARDGMDHYLVQWYREGGFVGHRDDGRDIEVRAGDITVLDLSRTLRTFAKPSQVTTMIVPRVLAEEAFGHRAPDLHGTVLRAESALGGAVQRPFELPAASPVIHRPGRCPPCGPRQCADAGRLCAPQCRHDRPGT